MKNLFTKYGLAVLLLAVLIAVLLSIMAFVSTSSALLSNLAGIIASPFRAVGSAVVGTVTGWGDYLTEFDRLKAENEALRKELAETKASIRQAEQDREENRILREQLELKAQRRDLTTVAARIVEQDSSNWSSMLTVNRGTAYGVAVGDYVVDANGYLVGEVTEAGLNWSTVRTVLDSETSLGAMVYRSGASAVAQGDFARMQEGRLTLGYLGTDPDVMEGDLVLTFGLGGYHPSGLVIGYVEETGTGDNGLAQYAVVRPEAALEDLSEVFIITDFVIED